MARLSKKAEAAWQAAFQEADDLYTQADCGCVVFVLVDMPDVVKYSQADIAEQALKGRVLHRCKRGELPPWNCPTHEAERQARKASVTS